MGVTICALRDPGEGAGEGTPLNPGGLSAQQEQDVEAGEGGGYKSPVPQGSEPPLPMTELGGGAAPAQSPVGPPEVVVQVPQDEGRTTPAAELDVID